MNSNLLGERNFALCFENNSLPVTDSTPVTCTDNQPRNNTEALQDTPVTGVTCNKTATPAKHYPESAVKHLSTPIKLSTVLFLSLAIASCDSPSYANTVHPHGELALAGYTVIGAHSPLRAFFVRTTSMRSHILMARLERDTFECAGYLLHLSANPFQLCHPHLAVNGKAPIQVIGAHTHA